MTLGSVMNFFVQTPSFAASAVAMYSASMIELAVVSYLELFQHTTLSFRVYTYYEFDLLSSISDWKLESM